MSPSFAALALTVACAGAAHATVRNEVVLASRAGPDQGAKTDGATFGPAISSDGRFVAFASRTTNLSPDDIDATLDVFLRDLATAVTTLISRTEPPPPESGLPDSGVPRRTASPPPRRSPPTGALSF